MTLALNTGHALYADLGMFICVNEAGTALVDLCTPSRTFTKHASAVFGTGALGRHFGARRNSPSGYSSYGFTFDTPYTPANNTGTLIVITNAVTSVEAATSGAGAFIGSGDASNGSRRLPQIGAQSGKIVGACFNNSGGDMSVSGLSSASFVSASPRMLTLVRSGETSHALYVNGNTTPEVSGGKLGTDLAGGYYSYIGGVNSVAPVDFDGVYIVHAKRVLTPTEISDLYATLGASNVFGLIDAPVNAAPTFSGTIANISGTQGTALTGVNVASLFSDTDALTYSKVGTWPGGVTLTGSTIGGTPTVNGTFASLSVRATDTASQTVDSNAFSITLAASGDTTHPTITGSITPSAITSSGFTFAWPAGADNVAVTGYEYSLNGGSSWTDAGNVLIKTVSGLTASTPYSVQVRDYDAAGNRADTPLSATITTSAAPGAGTITTNPMTTPNGLPLTSHTAHLGFDSVATGQQVLYKSSQVSHATTGRMTVTDIALVPGTDYCVTTIDPNAAPGDPCGARVYRAS